LNKLQERYKDRGFTIIGFPCAQFGLQEIALETEIINCLKFVRPGNNYPGPNFPLTAKILVNGVGEHPIYQWLKIKSLPWDGWTDQAWLTSIGAKTLAVTKGGGADIPWNFHKFLIARDGTTVRRFAHALQPLDPVLIAAIDELLAQQPPK